MPHEGSRKIRTKIVRPTPHNTGRLLARGELKVAVVGLGRIGLPTAAFFAEAGSTVTGIEIRKELVESINSGECPLHDEPRLAEIVRRSVVGGRLRATLKAGEAAQGSHFVVICVPVPVNRGMPDYLSLKAAALDVGKWLNRGAIVIVESTVGVGIVERLVAPAVEAKSGMKAGTDFGLASCPERANPGSLVEQMLSLPRIVGATTQECCNAVAALYELVFGVKAVRVSNPRTANAVKLTESLFRDVNIALANELALKFEQDGVDTFEVMDACATKYNFVPHYPGAGVGGSSLPLAAGYLGGGAQRFRSVLSLVRTARENQRQHARTRGGASFAGPR